MAYASKSQEAQLFAEMDKILESSQAAYSPSFSHYVWASDFCRDKQVLEVNCGAGLGTMILSHTASACTGLDINREMIKYALRNCYVEGKTKFTVPGDLVGNYSQFDVVVSFNTGFQSAKEIFRRIISIPESTAAVEGQNHPHGRTVILGIALDQLGPALVAKELAGLIPDNAQTSFYMQSGDPQNSISPFRADEEANDAVRLIAVIALGTNSIHSEKTTPTQRDTLDLVSVVIPTYNRGDLISEAIDSALNQTHSRIEVIVVDDGSNDNTKQVVAKYGNQVKYFYKENGGIGSALNFGIKKMSGNWFKWLSSDDVLTHNAVEIMLRHANATGAMISYTDYDIIDDNGNLIEKYPEHHFETYFEYASALWSRFIGNGSSILIQRSCFDDVGLFDETLRSAEDYEWWLRACLLHGHRFFHIPETTLKYRMHGNQLTAAVKHNAYVTAEKIRNRIKQQIISVDPGWWQVLERYQKLHAKQNQKGGFARRLLRKSLLHMPEGMRKSALKSWQHSLKPQSDPKE
jgi:glycosyltransferase involved in cell wall biosynthesis